jgi:hypothetical protein
MIWLITIYDEEQDALIVSHGIDAETDKVVILPQNPLCTFNAHWNDNAGLYYIH